MRKVTRFPIIALLMSLLMVVTMPLSVSAFEIPSEWDGDVNQDGDITIDDVTTLINGLITYNYTPSMNVNADSLLNIQDVADLITILLNMPPTIKPMKVNGVTFTMIYVRGGTFTMGATPEQEGGASSHERPAHQVTLAPYYIGETEVTQELWRAVMGGNPGRFKGIEHPVENVTWEECQEFVDRLSDLTGRNFRLLSEAEWEYAARGARKSKGYVYAGSNFLSTVGWYSANSNATSHIVTSKSANELGLYDMSGNVWEWCQDYWSDSYSGEAQINPVGPISGYARILRGGSWDDADISCRVSNRDSIGADQANDKIGLRVAMDVDGNWLSLSRRVISIEVGEQRSVNILNGSGNYTIYNNGSEYATCQANGDKLDLTGLNAGTAYITVKDNATQAMTTLTVIVYEPVVIKRYIINGVEFKMVYVKGGTYLAGATREQTSDAYSNEKPVHPVTLASFSIGQTEVTQELWKAVMGSNPSQFNDDVQCPVEKITWEDCQVFIARLNELTGESFRLPSEAEWEYAARGGKRSHGYKYAGSDNVDEVAWYSGNSSSKTHAVAQKRPNELSLYDMSGNVSEWCNDWYGSYAEDAVVNPTGPYTGSYRVGRGGNWSQSANYCRVSRREIRSATSGANLLGMRLAMDEPESHRFALSHTVVCMEVGEQRTVNIINGSCDYNCYNSNTNVVGCQVNGETLTLSGLAVGSSSVILLDNATGAHAYITVIVSNPIDYHKKTYYIHGVPFTMVYVPQGVLTMGATDGVGGSTEKPVHRVALSDYYIGETEVTQALWHAVMDYSPEVFTDEMKRPMADVSWEDCQVFVARLSEITGLPFRLPTEAEWEYAARGGRRTNNYRYAGSNTLSTVGWYSSNSGGATHNVAGKMANELGLYDMSGNVSEWCLDWYESYTDDTGYDPMGPDEGTARVYRGGAYNSTATNCRVSKRYSASPSTSSGSIGLRLAMDFDNSYRLYLSQSVVYMEVGDFKRVKVLNGSGDYSVYSSNNGVVDYQMNGNAMEFTGLKAGKAYFVIKDNVTHARRLVTVIVYNPSTPTPEPREFKYKTISWWMMYVRDGAFDMGATSEQGSSAYDNERPVHRVALNDYYIGQTEVTNELWQAVMNNFWGDLGEDAKKPAESIDWEDCLIFVDRLNEIFADYDLHFRLPTEAEWEFAARGGNRGRGYKYAGGNSIGSVAWYKGNAQTPNDPYYEYGSRQVKTKTPNELGLYDMSGNVAEWCYDYYGTYSEGGQFNPFGPVTGTDRVVRGGRYSDEARKCRVSSREPWTTGAVWTVLNGTGMRLAMDASNTHRFYLSRSVVRINVGEQANVNILHGTGQYTVTATHNGIVSYAVNGDQLSISGLKKGYTTLIVTDAVSGESTTVTVIVSEPYIPETEEFTVNGVSFKMITVDGGTFTMGDNSIEESSPAHQVTLSSYKIGQTEVTEALWEAVMLGHLEEDASSLNYATLYVPWFECQEFILKLNQLTGRKFRLLTEAEWEFAARGGNRSHGYTYSGSNRIDDVAWYDENSDAFSPMFGSYIDVATKAPNELGIYDMSGGVWEMCQDFYGEYTAGPQTNPTGPTQNDFGYRVTRGGSYNEEPEQCRVAARGTDPLMFLYGYGFRLALDIDDSPKFGLSETVVTVEVGESKTVNILNGGGSYTMAGSTDYFTRSISGNKLTVTGKAVGASTVHVTDNATGATAVLTVIVTYPTTPVEHEYVDLGLPSGTLWATCNVGASSPEDYGDYFAWGETEPKEIYDMTTYKWCNGSYSTITKYNNVDKKTELELEDDAAYVNWGPSWHMPTLEQQQELVEKCTWTWTQLNGVNGCLVTGPNANKLFLPAAGLRSGSDLNMSWPGNYWSCTLNSEEILYPFHIFFWSGGADCTSGAFWRAQGQTVRPVRVTGTPEPEEEEITVNGVTFKMITVDGGTFTMGDVEDVFWPERPAHEVTLSTYKIGQTQVTQQLWQAVMGSNPSSHTGDPQLPVESVSWFDCQEFILKLNQLTGLNFRMPTDAEWEFAARGGNYTHGYLYSGSNDINEVAWTIWAGVYNTQPVATKAPNELGIYDMTGNVEEWCQDWWAQYSADAQVNPVGPAVGTNRVIRDSGVYHWGGQGKDGYDPTEDEAHRGWYVTFRKGYNPSLENDGIPGLRLALDVDGNSKFRLSETVVEVEVGKSKTVNILNGNGSYTVAGGTDYVNSTLSGNKLTVKGKAAGTTTVHVTDNATGAAAVLTVIVTEATTPVEHEYVDLGLPSGTLWATCNIGASNPEEYGDYFAWGETEPKSTYSWAAYKWCNGTYNSLTKYCTNSSYGTVDNKTGLDSEDDAAFANWGEDWQMPSQEQIQELVDKCTSEWTKLNGVNGRLVTGPNGNTLFLPAAGYRQNSSRYGIGTDGYYWSCTLNTSTPSNACLVGINSQVLGMSGNISRYFGHTVRPVRVTETPEPEEEEFTVNGVTFKMVTVDGGTFMMGGDYGNGRPSHQVTLSDYKIGQTEVTQALWQAVMGSNPSEFTGNLQRPVDAVTWLDCQTFIFKLNQLTGKQFRLPTEAEWEFAARGGKRSLGYIYSGGNVLDDVAWYWNNSNTTQVVGTKKSNELGLYDMTGNVNEWCQDWCVDYTSAALTNPVGPATGIYRIFRGSGIYGEKYEYDQGGISYVVDDYRVVERLWTKPNENYLQNGLRLALDVDNSPKFSLSETVVTVKVGESKTVSILNGGGSYNLAGGTANFTSSVSGNRLTVRGTAVGTNTVTVTNNTDGAQTVLAVIVNEAQSDAHEYVDLGLPSGTLWATCNIGASNPEDYGDYFAWGETEHKDTYDIGNYKWCRNSQTSMTKYCTNSSYGYNGFTDNKTELEVEDDAAYVNWGEDWRMPSYDQLNELKTNCTWSGTTLNGVNGLIVTGPNGNSLFLPTAGYRYDSSLTTDGYFGWYWSRTLGSTHQYDAWNLGFSVREKTWVECHRYLGYSVRAVRASQN